MFYFQSNLMFRAVARAKVNNTHLDSLTLYFELRFPFFLERRAFFLHIFRITCERLRSNSSRLIGKRENRLHTVVVLLFFLFPLDFLTRRSWRPGFLVFLAIFLFKGRFGFLEARDTYLELLTYYKTK